jgi:YD repeat-containing protein
MSGSDYIWLWTHQKYDWMDRVVRKINTDGTDQTALNDSDILVSYAGCGCAGAVTTTVESERVPIPGTSNFARRKQKLYTDILGREFKTETFDWDGSTVYSSVVETYNGRDQVINTRQSGDGTYRDVTMTFDGHGRMKTRHYPIEDTGANTSWIYNPDNSIQTVTDPRGVVTSFTYNSRGLMTDISYDPGSTGVADTPDVSFEFDNVGNRTEMTDGTGNTSYVYDSLSRMTSETKYITDLDDDFTINYTYALSGSVLTYTDPQDSARKAEYAFDKTGRTSEAKNTYSGATKQRLHETQYRAWGALKKHTFSTVGAASTFSVPVQFDYDNRLDVSAHYSPYAPEPSGYQHYVEYDRNADGKINLSTDTLVQSFTRNFEYDHIGRVTKSLSGKAIHDITGTETPYRTTIGYNSFSEETSVTGKHWEVNNPGYAPAVAASTGRQTGLSYDVAGNVTSEPVPYVSTSRSYAFDAAGRNTSGVDPGSRTLQYTQNLTAKYDGNGWLVKDQSVHSTSGFTKTTYEFSSTVLGGETVGEWSFDTSEVTPDMKKFFSTANGVKMKYLSEATLYDWEWMSPEGTTIYGSLGTTPKQEFDPRGGGLGIENPYSGGGGYGGGGNYGDAQYYDRCAWGGQSIPCGMAERLWAVEGRINEDIRRRSKDGETYSPHLANEPAYTASAAKAKRDTSTAKTTKKTNKPEDDKKKGSSVTPASVPSDNGQAGASVGGDSGTLTGTVTEDDTVYGPADMRYGASYVNVRSENDLIDASVGAFNNDAGLRSPQTDRQIVRQNLVSFLNNGLSGDCADALRALKLKGQGLLNTFDKVKFAASAKKSAASASTSLNKRGPSTITTRTGVSEFLGTSQGFLIHELAHAATKISDRGIYNILAREQKAGNISGLPVLSVARGRGRRRRGPTKAQYSAALSRFFNSACVTNQSTPDDD